MTRHRQFWLAAAALAAISCGRQPAPAPEAKAAAPAREKAAASAVTLSAEAQRSAGVAVEPAKLHSIPLVLRATARLTQDDNRTWRVGAITEGRVVQVLANPGDVVKQGQVLARLHSHDIHEARAEYRKALGELARLQAVRDAARKLRDRAKRLYQLKAGALEQVEHAEIELRNAETSLANEQIEVERTRNHLVEFLGIPAEHTAHDKPGHNDEDDYIPVRSPESGVVLTRNVTPGAVVTPSVDLFLISDLSRIWAIAEVNEEHLSKLRPGMPARVFVQAYGEEAFPGRIGKLGEALDPATRTVKVRIELANRRGRLKPEMYASCEIEMGGSESALFVPQEAMQEVRGQNVVFVRTAADRFELRPVEPGRALLGSLEIRRGVSPGEVVVSRAAFVLKSEFLKASMAEE
jgi:multidrug efflux pump subunit AcrA (membrane-fusion protein)